MPKSDSLINLQGTLAGLTFVKSRAYGDHVRSKRGTFKKAELNQAMKEGSAKLQIANVYAKVFKDAIDPYRVDLIDGTLWQRLVSLFRKQLKERGAIDFGQMAGFEIHSDQKFERIIHVDPQITFERKKSLLQVDLQYPERPTFAKRKYVDGYKLTVIGVFPDLKKKASKTVAISSEVIRLTTNVTTFHAALKVPPRAKTFVVCVKMEGCEKGVVANTHTTKGICVLAGGNLETL